MSDDAHDVPACPCPGCGVPNDAASSAHGSYVGRPSPGDASVCLNCAAILVFREDLTTRLMTGAELADMAPDDRSYLLHARRMVLQVKASSLT